MTLYAGIDIGTSGIKVVLADGMDKIVAEAAVAIKVDRPQPGWSQQHPDLWWRATCSAFDRLAAKHPNLMPEIQGIGLSGQMLGAVLLDAQDKPTHPAILWNDQRALAECGELLGRVPDMGMRTAGHPDPGMTAPKLLWLAKHMPQAIEQASVLMLPKDYVRLCLTGERATEPSDAAGTLMLDCKTMTWDAELAGAAGWDIQRLPPLVASHAQAGQLRQTLQTRWGIPKSVAVAAGAGDNMACALGVGATVSGDAVVTIGTSGVLCAVDAGFHPAAHSAVLTNPHAAPGTYLSLGVVMSATQSLDWLAGLCATDVPRLAAMVDAMIAEKGIGHAPVMRPSLTGIRTPDNRPDAAASVSGIAATTDAAALAYAVMEGVAFQFLDCLNAQQGAGVPVDRITAVGGGSKNRTWVGLIATLFDKTIDLPKESSAAAAIGAARLGSVACGDFSASQALPRKSEISSTIPPDPQLNETLRRRYELFRSLPK
ncbi:MAG: xylulokinase [Rhodobacteraceae bacterium]|nr:xylulokinase [Paracoccaceae bacterium]